MSRESFYIIETQNEKEEENIMTETNAERLENMSPIGVDMNGNVLIKGEDWNWLGEQAETNIQNTSVVEAIVGEETLWQGGKYESEMTKLRKENERLRDILEKIAHGSLIGQDSTDLLIEYVKSARLALEPT